MSTITLEQQSAIAEFVRNRWIPDGLGDAEQPCSIAAINLALFGELTDSIPDCMSPVIGRWIICVQDDMPDSIRNSNKWKHLLPLAAGTGREKENERLEIAMLWMWSVVLPHIQPIAEAGGFGYEWRKMTIKKTAAAAREAAGAAGAAASAAEAAASAAWAAGAEEEAWGKFDPCGLLERLIEIEPMTCTCTINFDLVADGHYIVCRRCGGRTLNCFTVAPSHSATEEALARNAPEFLLSSEERKAQRDAQRDAPHFRIVNNRIVNNA